MASKHGGKNPLACEIHDRHNFENIAEGIRSLSDAERSVSVVSVAGREGPGAPLGILHVSPSSARSPPWMTQHFKDSLSHSASCPSPSPPQNLLPPFLPSFRPSFLLPLQLLALRVCFSYRFPRSTSSSVSFLFAFISPFF